MLYAAGERDFAFKTQIVDTKILTLVGAMSRFPQMELLVLSL
jgi:hypothetical protein